MTSRRLILRKETLTELSTDELRAVAGADPHTVVTYTYVPTGCMCTGMWPSLNIPCTGATTELVESAPC